MKNTRITICSAVLISVCLCSCAEAEIVAYSAPWCGFCRILEQYLEQHNIKFVKVSIDRNKKAEIDVKRKSGQGGIPVLDWEGEIIVGFGKVQREEIDRLIAGGVPVKGRFTASKTIDPKPDDKAARALEEELDAEQALYDFIYNNIIELDGLFALAERRVYDIRAADILEKLYDAHMARIVYEATFTEHFEKRIEQTSSGKDREGVKLIGRIKNIAGNRYAILYNNYRDARTRDLRAGIQAQKALKLAINQRQDEKEHNGYRNKNNQGYLLRLWACAAVNPKIGVRARPNYTEEIELGQDKITVEAGKILDELTRIQYEISPAEDVNNLVSSD